MKFLFPIALAAFDGYKITTPFGGLLENRTYSIAQYISVILAFSFGAIGVVALGAIVYWSLKWILSQGNASAIAQAKEGMWSAVWGIVLLFASYVILNTINPALVKLQATDTALSLPRVKMATTTSPSSGSFACPANSQPTTSGNCCAFGSDCGLTSAYCTDTDGSVKRKCVPSSSIPIP